jgi:DHA1 family multidrug resistance protein-like MFS transporter
MERWKINLYAIWATQVISLTSFGLGMPFLPFYIQELGVTSPEAVKWYTGLINALPAMTMAVMSPIWGLASDRFGRKLMIMRAMGAAVLIIGLMGMVTEMWQLITLRAIQGVFTGTVTAAMAFVASNTPKEKLSYAIGFVSSSTFMGYAIGPVLGGLVAEWFGYRISFFAGAGLMLVACVLVYFLVVEDPDSYGHLPAQKQKNAEPWHRLFTPVILMLMTVLLISRVTRTLFTPYIPLFVTEIIPSGVSAAKWTGYINGFAGFSTAIAAMTISRIGDRLNKRMLILILASIALCLSLVVVNTTHLLSFTLIYGLMFFFLGGIEPIAMSLTAEKTPASRRGTLFGFQGLVGSVGLMLSPMFGAWVSVSYGVRSILWILPVLLILNLVIVFFKGKTK